MQNSGLGDWPTDAAYAQSYHRIQPAPQQGPSWDFTSQPFPPVAPSPPPPPPPAVPPLAETSQSSGSGIKIVIPPTAHMSPRTRRSGRLDSAGSGPSGSEYHASDKSADMDESFNVEQDDAKAEEEEVQFTKSSRGRMVPVKRYVESTEEDAEFDEDEEAQKPKPPKRLTRSRPTTSSKGIAGFIASEDDQPQSPEGPRYNTRRSTRPQPVKKQATHRAPPARRSDSKRRTRSSAKAKEEEDGYEDHPSSATSEEIPLNETIEDEEELDAADGEADAEGDVEGDVEVEDDAAEAEEGTYKLRQRRKVNYAIPPPLEDIRPAPTKKPPAHRGGSKKKLGWSATGAEYDRFFGSTVPGGRADDSDSDYTRTPRKRPFGVGAGAVFAGGAGAGGSLFPSDLAAAAGTPSNLGKMGESALADADPLGVNQNVTFNEVGGLDDHINSLKEMTLLPLLYPEVFQKFGLTPPRGVLFHGPPGTGKTLLARALAASCRSNGKGISFFMRKGADCLSKWVGEAERQLRLLFEEARACQPSIIFFDEIDGLAPVRSSKQDQVHASIVSTMLALMDGMDGRGQVVVIGATNRPDAIDPALRRPGRFDREFYFPLPGLAAREKILGIMTKGWDGWGQGEGEQGSENVKGLAKLTKGYGGADLRALCTEAALNAVQRRYPQIYKSNDRLLLKPDTIGVELRDFMIAVKKLVPSSARSASTAATPLPSQFVPLLGNVVDRVKAVIDKAMPVSKKRTALEEAEWEDESREGALDRELMLQSMETLRVYRPRVILHGPAGMGQGYIGAAALHHMEGFHVQTLDLGSLMGDSTRTVEASIVQLFLEAKRNQPSVVYIPSLIGWCAALSETSRSTVRAMLDTLAPTDPVLLLAVVDGPLGHVPRDVRTWFGPIRDSRVELTAPSAQAREAFFEGLLVDVRRPPNQFPDGVRRRKRILEELPIAPPLQPREPTAAELKLQEESDLRTITLLKYRLGPILTELKRKFKKFTKAAAEEYDLSAGEPNDDPFGPVTPVAPSGAQPASLPPQANGANGLTSGLPNGHVEPGQPSPPDVPMDATQPLQQEQQQAQQELPLYPGPPKLWNMDLERIHVELYKDRYLTPAEFRDDVVKIVYNAQQMMFEDLERFHRAQAMLTATDMSLHDFDAQARLEYDRMAERERRRRKERRSARGKNGNGRAHSAAPNGSGDGAAPRRSTRNNGQLLQLEMTDPVELERKLKRQRSNEAGDSNGSGEDDGSETRSNKRSKMATDDEHDPLDLLGPRPNGVRFAEPPQVNIAAAAIPQHIEPVGVPPRPVSAMTPAAVTGPAFATPYAPEPAHTHVFGPESVNPAFADIPMDFASQAPQPVPTTSSSSINALLNPAPELTLAPIAQFEPQYPPPVQDIAVAIPITHNMPNTGAIPSAAPVAASQLPSHLEESRRSSSPTLASSSSTGPQQHLFGGTEESRVPAEADRPAPPAPMVVERSPTPPPPDFVVDEQLLNELRTVLVQSTHPLNVEELEQLRATCLGAVWKHRVDWDRTELLTELMHVVREFVVEASLDEDDAGETV